MEFNGSFKSGDVLTGIRGSGSFGAWPESCVWEYDRLVSMPATRRPGETMARFIIKPGDNCWTINDRNVIQKTNIHTINANETWETWAGFSHMLDPTFVISGATWTHSGGLTLNSMNFAEASTSPIADQVMNTGLALVFVNYNNLNLSVRHMQVMTRIIDNYKVGIWHDWMYHVKFSRTNNGFLELYHREEGQSNYTMIYSKYNYQTLFDYITNFGKSNDPMYTRLILYRELTSTNTQIVYNMAAKIGTTRADVEYPSPGCPTPQCKITITS